MSMISRRALFGLSVGAAAAAVAAVPAKAAPLRAKTYFTELLVSVDFGTEPAAVVMGNIMKQQFPVEWMIRIDEALK